MSDTSWKAYERRIARRLGTERIPVTGERNGADALTPMFAYQFKKRSKSTPPSRKLLAWLDGIRDAAARAGGDRIGVVVWQRSQGCLDSESLVVLRLEDWEALHRSRPGEDADVEMQRFDRAEFDALLKEVVALREWKAAHQAAAFQAGQLG